MRRKLLGDVRSDERGSENDRGGGEGRKNGKADLSQLRGSLLPQQGLLVRAQNQVPRVKKRRKISK